MHRHAHDVPMLYYYYDCINRFKLKQKKIKKTVKFEKKIIIRVTKLRK